MKNVLRVVTGLLGAVFFVMGLLWILSPSEIAEKLGIFGLLETKDLALSTQIGDLGSFFITVGAMTLIGALTQTRHWFYAPSMLLLVAALFRSLSTFHGAPFATEQIIIEVVVGLFLIFAGSRISKES